MEPYYFTQLDKQQKSAYQAIKTGLNELAPSFLIPRLENKDLGEIFFKLRLDYPEIFYGEGFKYRFYQESDHMEMIPEYLFNKAKIKEHQKALSSRINKLVRPALQLSELEKEQYIHDFICSNVVYDKLKKQYSHEIIGPLGHGVGVCEGIAKAVKILCDSLGIWCVIAISEANKEKGIRYRHAWNIVRVGGQYYHLDATFDNSLGHGAGIRYDYFNLSDKQFFRDHQPVIYQVPSCNDNAKNYYSVNKLAFTKMEQVEKRALWAMRKKQRLVFLWKGSYLTREVLNEILALLGQTAAQKGKHIKVSLNWPQAVLGVDFVEMELAEELIIEEANEGEL